MGQMQIYEYTLKIQVAELMWLRGETTQASNSFIQ